MTRCTSVDKTFPEEMKMITDYLSKSFLALSNIIVLRHFSLFIKNASHYDIRQK